MKLIHFLACTVLIFWPTKRRNRLLLFLPCKKRILIYLAFLFPVENGEPPPFASHPALTAALQNGPDGDGSVLSGARALESCAYLAQSMLAHNFRDPSGLDPNHPPGNGRFIPPDSESSQELPPNSHHLHSQIPTSPGYTSTPSYLTNEEGINVQPQSE